MQSNTKPTTSRSLSMAVAAVVAVILLIGGAGGVASASTANQLYVQQLYSRYIGRTPGAGELGYWSGVLDGANRVAVVNAFFHTEEASAVQASSLIHIVLSRASDPSGAGYWGHQLASGLPRAELLAQLYASGEFYANQGATDENYVFGIYQSFLGRNPTQGDRSYWAQVAQSQGRLVVARTILGSTEGITVLIDAAYRLGVQHGADPSGSSYWANQMATGTLGYDGVIVHIIGSAEAYAQAQAA
jgi:hypothetical protein